MLADDAVNLRWYRIVILSHFRKCCRGIIACFLVSKEVLEISGDIDKLSYGNFYLIRILMHLIVRFLPLINTVTHVP